LDYISVYNVRVKKRREDGSTYGWWTHKKYVLKEVPEHEAVLEMLK
jgi:hypothetical protein